MISTVSYLQIKSQLLQLSLHDPQDFSKFNQILWSMSQTHVKMSQKLIAKILTAYMEKFRFLISEKFLYELQQKIVSCENIFGTKLFYLNSAMKKMNSAVEPDHNTKTYDPEWIGNPIQKFLCQVLNGDSNVPCFAVKNNELQNLSPSNPQHLNKMKQFVFQNMPIIEFLRLQKYIAKFLIACSKNSGMSISEVFLSSLYWKLIDVENSLRKRLLYLRSAMKIISEKEQVGEKRTRNSGRRGFVRGEKFVWANQ